MMEATTKLVSIEESINASLNMVFALFSCKHHKSAVTHAMAWGNLFHSEMPETCQKHLVLVLAFTSEVRAAQHIVHRLIERLLRLFINFHDAWMCTARNLVKSHFNRAFSCRSARLPVVWYQASYPVAISGSVKGLIIIYSLYMFS